MNHYHLHFTDMTETKSEQGNIASKWQNHNLNPDISIYLFPSSHQLSSISEFPIFLGYYLSHYRGEGSLAVVVQRSWGCVKLLMERL